MNKTYLLPLLAFLSGVIIYSIFLLSESGSRNFLTHSADSLMIILTFVGAGSIYGLCTIFGIYKTLDVESFNKIKIGATWIIGCTLSYTLAVQTTLLFSPSAGGIGRVPDWPQLAFGGLIGSTTLALTYYRVIKLSQLRVSLRLLSVSILTGTLVPATMYALGLINGIEFSYLYIVWPTTVTFFLVFGTKSQYTELKK